MVQPARVPQITDGFLVSLEHFKRIHVGLPVLDKPIMISCDHPIIIVAPFHGSDGRVVCRSG
jgi:hypothetical protein